MLYLPFSYTFLTRNRTLPYKAAYILTYIIPIVIIAFYFQHLDIFLLVSLTGTVCIYEIGYLENDHITVQFEKKPTVRLKCEDQEWIRRRLPVLSSIRRLYAFLAAVILYFSGYETVWLYLFLLVGLDMVYALHNVIRSRWNCLTLGMLTLMKHLTPVVVFASGYYDIFNMVLVILFLCSIVRSVEHANKYRAFSNILLVKYDYFRMLYYLVMFLISVTLWYFFRQGKLLLWLSGYFLTYRSLCVLLIRRKETYNRKEKDLD